MADTGDRESEVSRGRSFPTETLIGGIGLNVPAEAAFVPTLVSLSAGLATRCRLNLDSVEDFRLAVDEACTLLLPYATPGSTLRSSFELNDHAISAEVTVSVLGTDAPPQDGYGWALLHALTSDARLVRTDGMLAISMFKADVVQP